MLSIMFAPQRVLVSLVLFGLCTSSAKADFVFQMIEQTNSVFFRGEGSLDVNGLTLVGQTTTSPGVLADCCFIVGETANTMVDIYVGNWSGPNALNNAGPFDPFHTVSSGNGSVFGVDFSSQAFFAPNNYVSGAVIQGESTFANESLASLQLTEGNFAWTLGTNNISLEILSITAVPEPSGFLPFLISVMGLAFRRQMKRQAAHFE